MNTLGCRLTHPTILKRLFLRSWGRADLAVRYSEHGRRDPAQCDAVKLVMEKEISMARFKLMVNRKMALDSVVLNTKETSLGIFIF